MSTNVEGSQVRAVLVEGVVVEFGKLLCVSLSSSRPSRYHIRELGPCSGVLHLRAIALKSERSC